jgi:hypothetical protein
MIAALEDVHDLRDRRRARLRAVSAAEDPTEELTSGS